MPPPASEPPGPLEILGGHLALDLVNTFETRVPEPRGDVLTTGRSFLRWAATLDLGDSGTIDSSALSRRSEESTARELARLRGLRETLHGIFTARLEGRAPRAEDLSRLEREAARGARLRNLRVATPEGALSWRWSPVVSPADLGARAAWEAAELLTSEDADRVSACPAPDGCGYLFLDRSKNRSRRWCSMAGCGTLAKVRRHRRRRRR